MATRGGGGTAGLDGGLGVLGALAMGGPGATKDTVCAVQAFGVYDADTLAQ